MSAESQKARAPEFPPAVWINTPAPLTMAGLRGQVVLADFWDYTSADCLLSLPYKRAWHQRYADLGLTIVGLHAPRYRFARERAMVASAAGRLGLSWPIALDNEGHACRAFSVRALPTGLLIDRQGNVRSRHTGHGGYAQQERLLQALLAEGQPSLAFPDPVPPVRLEDVPGALCPPTTPDLGLKALGNPGPLAAIPTLLEAPVELADGRFYLEGLWRSAGDGLALAGETGGIHLRYRAATVGAVLSPTPDPVDLLLDLQPVVEVQLRQDNLPLVQPSFAEDVFLAEGQARVRVDRPRLYALVRNHSVRPRRLHLEVHGAGLTLYGFAFGSRADPAAAIESRLSHSRPHSIPTE